MALLNASKRMRPAGASTRRGPGALAGLLAGLVLFFALAAPAALHAQDLPNPKEYQIKAVFLFNFVQFTTWPESAFADAGAPVRIGILGTDPFGGALEAAVRNEKVGQRPVVVEHFARLQDVRDCHVVFVSRSESAQAPAIIAAFAGKPVLTVGDLPDFAGRGGIVNFYLDGQKIRFEINRAAAQRSGFRLSSQLLGLARLVGPTAEAGVR